MVSKPVRILERLCRLPDQFLNRYLSHYFNQFKAISLGACLVTALTACTTTIDVPQDEINTKFTNLSASEALASTAEHFNQAISEQYDVFSPSNWQEASDALSQAQAIAKQTADSQEILKLIYVVDRRLESAQYIKNSVQKQYRDLFTTQRTLNDNLASESYPQELKQIDSQLQQHIKDYEDLTLGKNKEKVSQRTLNVNAHQLLNDMRSLHFKVVKFNYLHEVEQDLAKMEQRDVKTVAPRSYQDAVNALAAANQYIENNVHDKDGIRRVADAFRFAVDHVAHVSQTVIELSGKNINQLEDVVLANEQYLYAIGLALGNIDVRNMSLAEQSRALVNTANNMLAHHTEKSSMIVELSEQNLLLQSELKKYQQSGDGSEQRLKLKVTALEQEVEALEREREKLKDDVFALQQKNIDLAIQNARLTTEMERKNGKGEPDKNSGRNPASKHAADANSDKTPRTRPVSFGNHAVYIHD